MSIYGNSQAIQEEMLKDITFLLEQNEQLNLNDVVKSLKGVDKIPFDEWKNKTFYEIGTNRFELRTNTSLIYSMDEICKSYNSF